MPFNLFVASQARAILADITTAGRIASANSTSTGSRLADADPTAAQTRIIQFAAPMEEPTPTNVDSESKPAGRDAKSGELGHRQADGKKDRLTDRKKARHTDSG